MLVKSNSWNFFCEKILEKIGLIKGMVNIKKVIKIIHLNNYQFEITEDDNNLYFKELSSKQNKATFSVSKTCRENNNDKYGLKIYFTKLFKY
ncbi:hypothetical protein J6TS2_35040 [Heyndrickxia sporothermodurans]|nr:hypothetical protein J6TS2_35040 [Heyndrickxia sporothermodurans]